MTENSNFVTQVKTSSTTFILAASDASFDEILVKELEFKSIPDQVSQIPMMR
jgi:hypothetical protein